eukprot:CAMPEP_0175957276 /NCGR_PEP_ID=MMETSP0108-20121206/33569_1 /TAXON_ID=195067 ORGANISM="Goniomonas pacifica, Strain CCMP1869" /NCGR_SAMPLE_ID=MMETSP0108 /ASSEMBLY_ACC=CAM_ASM_000204 /LENGTH=173 /DNA_ID=CAMNT_0017284435 /DNA_START=107 /DNA_END=623 /DNA_ORIENTATION=+
MGKAKPSHLHLHAAHTSHAAHAPSSAPSTGSMRPSDGVVDSAPPSSQHADDSAALAAAALPAAAAPGGRWAVAWAAVSWRCWAALSARLGLSRDSVRVGCRGALRPRHHRRRAAGGCATVDHSNSLTAIEVSWLHGGGGDMARRGSHRLAERLSRDRRRVPWFRRVVAAERMP